MMSEICDPRSQANRMGFGLLSLALLFVMLGGTLPSPLYVLYRAQLSLNSSEVAALFAAYVVGALAALLTAGHLSNHHGRLVVMLYAVIVAAASDAMFLLSAHSYAGLVVARVLSGLSIGLVSSAATAALSELTDDKRLAALVSGTVTMLGLGVGALLGGLLAEWLPLPLTLPFIFHLVLLFLAAVFLLLTPETVSTRTWVGLRSPRLVVPRASLPVFRSGAAAGFSAFALVGLFSSFAGTFLATSLHETSLAISGMVTFAINAIASIASVALGARMSTERMMRVGLIGLLPGLAATVLAVDLGNLFLFLVAVVICGCAGGLCFQGGIRHVLAVAEPASRAGISSAFFVVAYAGMSVPVLAAGFLVTALGVNISLTIIAVVIALIAVAALIAQAGRGGRSGH